MSAVERLEAAITKLETLKVESTPGPWEQGFHWDGEWIGEESDTVGQVRRGDGTYFSPVTIQWYHGGEYGGRYVDARLIVTLHRTIDAQLAILRAGLEQAKSEERYPHYWYAPPKDGTLALADAVLGGDSDASR